MGLVAASFWGGAEGSARAQQAPRYMTSQEDIDDPSVVKLKDRASVAFQLYSVVPTSRPFQSVDDVNGARDFRYQIAGGFGAEFAYKLMTNLDLGLNVAYELYESRMEQSAAFTAFSTARMRLFPILATARWQWPQGLWSPEAELGVGTGIFNLSVDSSDAAQTKVEESSSALLAHGAAGLSLAWLDETNIGFMVGYRQMLLGSKDFDASLVQIRRKSLSGLFAKASLRYHF
jgi:hypothetical protein